MSRTVFALLLRAFPRDVRHRYGQEMLSTFESELAQEGAARGLLGALGYALAAYSDVLSTGLQERKLGRRDRASWGDGMETMKRGAPMRGWGAGMGAGLFSDIAQDMRFGLRGLIKERAFTTVAVFSLAIGIGTNTAIFSIVQATYLQSVAGVTQPERVVELLRTRPDGDWQEWSYPDFLAVRASHTPIEEVAGWKQREGSLSTDDGGQRVRMMYVSPSYFRVLGVAPAHGRAFDDSEDSGPGEHAVAIVSHDMWQNRLGGKLDLVGRTITLNRTPYTVVGITPEEFRGHRPLGASTEVWLPMTQAPFIVGEDAEHDRAMQWMLVLGRLRDGAKVSEANAALQTVFARLAAEHAEIAENESARAARFGPFPALNRTGQVVATSMLVGFVGLVLLIICGNVAGMVLARSATRERELAVRMAIGSGRGRLIRQLMVEALLIAGAGGGLGVFAAIWGISLADAAGMGMLMPGGSLSLSTSVLAFSLGLTVATTFVFGLFPALRFSRPELVSSLRDEAGGGGSRVGRIHRVAASAQAGVALLLLMTAGVFTRSLSVMDETDIGYEPEGMVVATMDLSSDGYETLASAAGFLDDLRESVASVPSVTSVALSDGFPLDAVGNYTAVSRADQPGEDMGRVLVEFTSVGTGYFETTKTTVLRGRALDANDTETTTPVVVITQPLADRLFPDEEAVGRDVRFPMGLDGSNVYRVVGVTGPMASSRATEDQPHVFVALRQHYNPHIRVLVRSTGDASALLDPVQAAIVSIDSELTRPIVVTAESIVRDATEAQRVTAQAAAGLGLLALLLSAVGVYGVIGFMVANRTREIGLRIAIGATRSHVLGGVIRDALNLTVPGLVVGTVVAVATAAVMQSMLLGVSPADPLSFLAAAVILLFVIVAASLAPARRAAAVHPVEALGVAADGSGQLTDHPVRPQTRNSHPLATCARTGCRLRTPLPRLPTMS